MKRLAIAGIVLAAALLVFLVKAGQSAVSQVDTGSTSGWIVVATDGSKHQEQLRLSSVEQRSSLLWDVPRTSGKVYLLARPQPLANFSEMEFDLWSKDKTVFGVFLDDSDGAGFQAHQIVEPNKWTHVKLQPTSFRMRDDSPVKKQVMEPAKLTPKLVFADLGVAFGMQTPTQVALSNAKITFGGSKQAYTPASNVSTIGNLGLPEVVDGTTYEVAKSGTLSHKLVIKNGGRVRIRSARVVIAANIDLDNGTLIFDHSNVTLHNRFSHERSFNASNGSLMRFDGCQVDAAYPSGIGGAKSTIEIIDTEFTGGGFTAGNEQGSIVLRRSKKPGEFIIPAGSKLLVEDCELVLIWPAFKTGDNAAVSYPASPHRDITVRNSSFVLWGTLQESGSNLTINGSSLFVLGVIFKEPGDMAISGIKDGEPVQAMKLNLPDRKLALNNCTVRAWNFYPMSISKVKISDSIFGELNAFENSQADVTNSTCDGLGGYVLAQNHTKVSFTGCKLTCDVVATDDASLTLTNCTVTGKVTASGRARLKLINTKCAKAPERLDSAVIE